MNTAARRWPGDSVRAGLTCIVCLLLIGALITLVQADRALPPGAGHPHYPDLVAIPPTDLFFSTEILDDGLPHVLLRFSSSVSNLGDGPLELRSSADADVRNVNQVIYDAPSNGSIVGERPLGIDLVEHPSHHHFHLNDFATYELFLLVSNEASRPTGAGGKQSSCVIDGISLGTAAGQERQYATCGIERQGLSVGWQDAYPASLPDQWVDLGTDRLADGQYELRYTVDPLGRIAETGTDDNNVASMEFTVRGGAIVGRPEPPRCRLERDEPGSPGERVTIVCSHFDHTSNVSVYWDAWDPWNPSGNALARFVAEGEVEVATTISIPDDAATGAYTVTAVAYNSAERRYVATSVIVGVTPPGGASPSGLD